MHVQRAEIEEFEQEAEDLEKMEVELLKKLQETQKKEKDAYSKLEGAMIETAIPKNQRVLANKSVSLAGESVLQTDRTGGAGS